MNIEQLHVSTVDVKPIDIDWNPEYDGEYVDPIHLPQWWDTLKYEGPGDKETLLVASGGSIVAYPFESVPYERGEWDAFHADHTEAYGEPDLTQEQFDDLFDVEPYLWGAEGPMMNYWYPISENAGQYSRFDPVEAALKIADEPLCIVLVEDQYGLALTGGGMDLSWEICSAFIKLGKLPPVHFANLPKFAGLTLTGDRENVYLAMKRSLEWMRDQMTYRLERLADLKE